MKKFLLVVGMFTLAFVVLFISIFNSSAITYTLSRVNPTTSQEIEPLSINYVLPYVGRVLPDSPFWPLKAIRDKVWFVITPSHLRKAQLALLSADKRIEMSRILFKKGEGSIALSTYTKGEKYLTIAVEEERLARAQGLDTSSFLTALATAALKHMEITKDLMQLAPDEAKPVIIRMQIFADNTYKSAADALNAQGLPVPKNPFIGD